MFDRGGFEALKKGKTVTLASGRSKTVILFDAVEFDFLDGLIGNLACKIPPSTVMIRYYTEIDVDIDIPQL